MCYFPITFQGITQFVPPRPFEISNTGGSIPSDTVAFALYSRALENMGHSLDPRRLVEAMKAFGATEVACAASDWNIDPALHPYLWQTMLHFFERSAGPELLKNGWDAAGWLNRARGQLGSSESMDRQCPNILVSNLDMLFRLPRLGFAQIFSETGAVASTSAGSGSGWESAEEIEFTAPFKVSTKKVAKEDLMPNQIRSKWRIVFIDCARPGRHFLAYTLNFLIRSHS